MRETVSLASSYQRQKLPASLMLRLELMQQLALAAQAQANGQPPQGRPRGARRSAHVIVLAWFSFGVIVSGAMGAGAVVGLRTLAAGAPSVVAAPAVASWSYPRPDWDTVHVVIDRSQRVRAPLALQVTGADDGAFEVVLHGVPAGVRPSRGAPIGEGTWALRPADLDGLYLTLDSTVPDTFDLRIAVLTSPGIAIAGSIVQVRVVEVAPSGQAPVAVGAPAAASTPAPVRSAATRGGDKAAAQSSVRRTEPVAASTGKTWPEGAYGLGALPREPEEEGKSWWQMPPPSWSPFLVGQERP